MHENEFKSRIKITTVTLGLVQQLPVFWKTVTGNSALMDCVNFSPAVHGASDAWGMNQFRLESFTSSSWNTEVLKIHIIWLTGLLFICSFTHVVCGGVSACVACDSDPPPTHTECDAVSRRRGDLGATPGFDPALAVECDPPSGDRPCNAWKLSSHRSDLCWFILP